MFNEFHDIMGGCSLPEALEDAVMQLQESRSIAAREENAALREENFSLEERLEEAERLEKENERLREYLGMKQENPSFTLEMAEVISRESGNYATVLTLNRGSIHGIEENMAVVVKECTGFKRRGG